MSTPKDRIITLPHADLRERSTKVGIITKEIEQLIADMEAATLDWEDHRDHEVGVALAAVQIDVLRRVVIVRSDFDDKNDRSFQVFINPEIVKYDGKIIEDFEGCLSIKDIYGKVPRHERVKVKALNIKGQEFRITAEGFLARVFQHEIDHTNGVMFIDHIKDKPDAFFHLNNEGKLEALDYEKGIRNSRILW